MTPRAEGPSRRVPRMWLVPLAVLTGLLALVAVGYLSRSFVLDLAASWPVWAVVALVAVALRSRRVGRVLLSGIVPLIALASLAALVVAHLQGWPGLPSSESRLVGPPTDDVETAELRAHVDGTLIVGSGSEFLYVVEPVRRGGVIGIPGATEDASGTHTSVELTPIDGSDFYRFSGWVVNLASTTTWILDLAGNLDADLADLDVADVTVTGSGTVEVGSVASETHMTVDGDFELVVPVGTAVRIIGEADVPMSWIPLTDGWESPTTGSGWVIEMTEASTLKVTQG